MKRMLIAFVLVLSAAADCGQVDGQANYCCGDGKHPESSGNFKCQWDDNGNFYCYVEVDCVANED
jgi:hypothetical protein